MEMDTKINDGVALADRAGVMPLFGRHGLAGLVIGAQFLLIGYVLFTVNGTMTELIAVNRELKVLIQTLVK